jgi:hypothetical protein
MKRVEAALSEYLSDARDVAIKLRLIDPAEIKIDASKIDQLTKLTRAVTPVRELKFVRELPQSKSNQP